MPVNRSGIASVVAIGEFENDALAVQEPLSRELSRFANAGQVAAFGANGSASSTPATLSSDPPPASIAACASACSSCA